MFNTINYKKMRRSVSIKKQNVSIIPYFVLKEITGTAEYLFFKEVRVCVCVWGGGGGEGDRRMPGQCQRSK